MFWEICRWSPEQPVCFPVWLSTKKERKKRPISAQRAVRLSNQLSAGLCAWVWLQDGPVNHLVCSLLEMTSVPSRCLMSLSGAQWEPGFVRKRKTNWLSSCCTTAGSVSSFYISSKTSKYINISVIFHKSFNFLWDQDTLQYREMFLSSCQPVKLLSTL